MSDESRFGMDRGAGDVHGVAVSRFVMCTVASAVLFAIGLAPGYVAELEGYERASARCPMPEGSEQSYDPDCLRELAARGPLYLGKEFLAGSFVLGVVALFMLHRLDRPLATGVAAVGLAIAGFLTGVPLTTWTVHPSIVAVTAVIAGIGLLIAAALIARWRNDVAVAVVAALYFAAWAGLLVWNADEGRRLDSSGAL